MVDLRKFLPFTSELQKGEVRIQNGWKNWPTIQVFWLHQDNFNLHSTHYPTVVKMYLFYLHGNKPFISI